MLSPEDQHRQITASISSLIHPPLCSIRQGSTTSVSSLCPCLDTAWVQITRSRGTRYSSRLSLRGEMCSPSSPPHQTPPKGTNKLLFVTDSLQLPCKYPLRDRFPASTVGLQRPWRNVIFPSTRPPTHHPPIYPPIQSSIHPFIHPIVLSQQR